MNEDNFLEQITTTGKKATGNEQDTTASGILITLV
jgi:hypothetical protein